MKNRVCFLLILTFSFLISCSNSELQPVIVKSETPPADSEQNPALTEEKISDSKEDGKEAYIEFSLPDEKVKINLASVEVLNQYLTTIPNRQAETAKMSLTRLDIPDRETFYLLEFSCTNDLCSYILLNQEGKGDSRLLADIARLRMTAISPDSQKVMFLFDRENKGETSPVTQTKLIALNLENLKSLKLQGESGAFETDFQWPITSANWKNDSTIQIVIPAIDKPDVDALKAWNESEKETKIVDIITIPNGD